MTTKMLRFTSFLLLKLINLKMVVNISRPPPLISQLFHPGPLRVAAVCTAWLFLHGFNTTN